MDPGTASRSPQQEDVDETELAADGEPAKSASARRIIKTYLCENCPEFRELTRLRAIGWSNEEGDRYFEKQRAAADNADQETARRLYGMMQDIGREIKKNTAAFEMPERTRGRAAALVPATTVLDLCSAPGGFLSVALASLPPNSQALAFTLPVSSGGHEFLLPAGPSVEKRFLDITMCAADIMGDDGAGEIIIDPSHPEAEHFLPRQLPEDKLFDLVLCDGQVLRTHAEGQAAHRRETEAARLTAAQLAIGLAYLRPGGTVVMLLHKLEAPGTARLVRAFRRLAAAGGGGGGGGPGRVQLYKPTRSHRMRSSFYMVASGLDSEQAEARRLVGEARRRWKVATFGTGDEYAELMGETRAHEPAEELIRDFGAELVEMGRPVWRVQAQALARAPFVHGRGNGGRESSGS